MVCTLSVCAYVSVRLDVLNNLRFFSLLLNV